MGRELIDLSGRKYGRWTVLERAANRGKAIYWLCHCDCGTTRKVSAGNLTSSVSVSCGCLRVERVVAANAGRTDFPNTPRNLIGQSFGKWRVLARGGLRARIRFWVCHCECGTEREVATNNLTSGKSTSCGCVHRLMPSAMTHGMSQHPIYISWQGMKDRCMNPAGKDWKHYGGRGIQVCGRWIESFDNFLADMGSSWRTGMTIERISVNGNYEPSNCCWASQKEQMNNTRRSVFVETPWGRMNFSAAAKKIGISQAALRARLKHAWPADQLFSSERHTRWSRPK